MDATLDGAAGCAGPLGGRLEVGATLDGGTGCTGPLAGALDVDATLDGPAGCAGPLARALDIDATLDGPAGTWATDATMAGAAAPALFLPAALERFASMDALLRSGMTDWPAKVSGNICKR